MKNECLIFYVKSPKEGYVKTRLARDIGNEHAVALYRCFIMDLTDTLKKLSQDVILCYSPKNAEAIFRSWLGNDFDSWLGHGFHYVPQSDGDLGMRMKKSFEQAFENGYERAVLIGSDSPDLPESILEQAFIELQSSDAVIGPATDGGYWLIGFSSKGFCLSVFEGISWSMETVFVETMEKLKQEERTVALLPEWTDIDTLASLLKWYKIQTPLSIHASYTRSYVDTHLSRQISS